MGTTTYRTVDEQGNITYSDQPPSGVVYTYDHATVVKAIKIVRKHVPKTPSYLEYLDHLRHYDAIKFNNALRALQGLDRDVYMKVLAISREHYSLKGALEPAVTGRAFTASHVSKGTIVTGEKYAQVIRKWLEGTVGHMMKKDLSRLSPSSQQKALQQQLKELEQLKLETVKATRNAMERGASNEVIKNNESLRKEKNSAIGRTAFSLEAETRLQKEKAATKAMNRAADAARASAVARAGSGVLDAELQLLNPGTAEATGNFLLRKKLNEYEHEGIISPVSCALLIKELGSQAWVVTGVLNLLDADMKKRVGSAQINDDDINDYIQDVKKMRGVR